MRKAQAIKELAENGYTLHTATGESGDHGYGSRLYFVNPSQNVKLEDGFPIGPHASISKVGSQWYPSYFPR